MRTIKRTLGKLSAWGVITFILIGCVAVVIAPLIAFWAVFGIVGVCWLIAFNVVLMFVGMNMEMHK